MMSLRRLTVTTAVMTAIAFGLSALAPGAAVIGAAFTRPQALADTVGPDAVVSAWAALLAWSAWAWGAFGLALTALGALPGALGSAARLFLRAVLPVGARRGAALVLGIGLGVGLTAPAVAAPPPPGSASAAPDWSSAPPAAGAAPDRAAAVPDWPAPAVGDHVVVRGDCLWDIAAGDLRSRTGRAPTDGEVAAAVQAWWQANAEVIGPDPGLLLPGQVLSPPAAP